MDNKLPAEWLKAAYADLRVIEHIVDDEFLTHIVAFHAQQTIEKSLKAILEYESKRVPRVHKLQNLISKIDRELPLDNEILEILDELYIDSRYPNDMGLLPYGKPTVEDAIVFYDFSRNIFDIVCDTLKIDRESW